MKHPPGSNLDRCVSRPDVENHNDTVKVFTRLGGRSKLDENGEVIVSAARWLPRYGRSMRPPKCTGQPRTAQLENDQDY